mgnify:CR=1 FL=1
MSAAKKVDNTSLASKIAIRRWLLSRIGIQEVYVLDTCAGLGKVWEAMEKHVVVRQWTRCDQPPRRTGTLALSAVDAIVRFPLETYNVIDIDPYGEPWEAYRALLSRLSHSVAVFLTHGHKRQASVNISADSMKAIGIPVHWPIPRTANVSTYVAQHALGQSWRFATITCAGLIESIYVTYYALALTPLKAGQETRRGS